MTVALYKISYFSFIINIIKKWVGVRFRRGGFREKGASGELSDPLGYGSGHQQHITLSLYT